MFHVEQTRGIKCSTWNINGRLDSRSDKKDSAM